MIRAVHKLWLVPGTAESIGFFVRLVDSWTMEKRVFGSASGPNSAIRLSSLVVEIQEVKKLLLREQVCCT